MPENRFRAALIERAGIAPGAAVLDLGCGTGSLLLGARAREPHAVLYGIDLDREVLEIAARKSHALGANLLLYRGAVDRLPFRDAAFDRVLSTLVFHHLSREAKQAALGEAFRVLRPGGELHVADWGKPASALMRAAFFSVQALDGFRTTRDNVAGYLPRFMTEAGFGAVAETGCINTLAGTLRLHRASKPV
jgi:ubiquinone/menaquinone biosynthesis C-methylase UbiE